MARPSNEEKELKLTTLWECIHMLIDKSTPVKNHLTIPNLVQVANSSENSEKFKTKISEASIKQPSSAEYKEIASKIKDHKKNFRTTKETVSKKVKDHSRLLEEQNENLRFELAKLLDNTIKLHERVDSLENSLKKVTEERDKYFERLNGDS